MQSALEKVDGVEDVEIDFASKTATIKTNGAVKADELVGAFEGTRFQASVD